VWHQKLLMVFRLVFPTGDRFRYRIYLCVVRADTTFSWFLQNFTENDIKYLNAGLQIPHVTHRSPGRSIGHAAHIFSLKEESVERAGVPHRRLVQVPHISLCCQSRLYIFLIPTKLYRKWHKIPECWLTNSTCDTQITRQKHRASCTHILTKRGIGREGWCSLQETGSGTAYLSVLSEQTLHFPGSYKILQKMT